MEKTFFWIFNLNKTGNGNPTALGATSVTKEKRRENYP